MTKRNGKIERAAKKALLNNIEAVGLGKQGQREKFTSPGSGSEQTSGVTVCTSATSITPPVSAFQYIESMTNKLIDAFRSSPGRTTAASVEDDMKQLQMEALRAQIRASNAQEAF